MRNVTFLCTNVQTDECVATLGPIGCWFSMVGGGGGAAGPVAGGGPAGRQPTQPEGESPMLHNISTRLAFGSTGAATGRG